jgi:hypothetical protein
MEQKQNVENNLSWREAIIEVLKTSSKPMSSVEIVAAIKERGLRNVTGNTPEATVGAQIYSSIKKDGECSPFVQISPNVFRFKQPSNTADDVQQSNDVSVPANDPKSAPKILKRKIPLSYDDPLKAVLLRRLAWEAFVARPVKQLKIQLKVKDVTGELITDARNELGFSPVSRGPSSDFYNKVMRIKPEPLIKDVPYLQPTQKEWEKAWRLLNLPSHSFVRRLSNRPIIVEMKQENSGHIEYNIALRDPAMPRLKMFIGMEKPKGDVFGERRGVYFLRLPNKFYIGKSDEFNVRLGGHLNRENPDTQWWLFLSPEESDKTFTLDALGATEALLISFWNEVCNLSNGSAGADQKPGFAYLQQAILFVTAASAAMIWILREKPTNDLGIKTNDCDCLFKRPSAASGKGWPDCYLNPPKDNRKQDQLVG